MTAPFVSCLLVTRDEQVRVASSIRTKTLRPTPGSLLATAVPGEDTP